MLPGYIKQDMMYIISNASDTDVMVLAISAIEKLRGNTSIIEGTGPRRRIVKLQPIYDALGENKVQAIGGFFSSNPMIA